MTTSKDSKNKLIFVTYIIAAILVTIYFVNRIIKDFQKNIDKDIVSDEGKKIIGDPEKRKILRAAIDKYQTEGNWSGLDPLSQNK